MVTAELGIKQEQKRHESKTMARNIYLKHNRLFELDPDASEYSGKPTTCLLSYVNHDNYSSLPYTGMCATPYFEGTFTLISNVHVVLGPSFLPPLITLNPLSEEDPE